MKIELEIPDQTVESGTRLHWEPGCEITIFNQGDEIIIRANTAGLRTLAGHLLAVSVVGGHIHLDDTSGLEPGSGFVILENTEQ